MSISPQTTKIPDWEKTELCVRDAAEIVSEQRGETLQPAARPLRSFLRRRGNALENLMALFQNSQNLINELSQSGKKAEICIRINLKL